MTKTVEKAKKHEERLMGVFGFDEDDLEANQRGQLSPQQVFRLKSARNSTIRIFALLVLSFLLIALFVAGVGIGISAVLPALTVSALASGLFYFIYGRKARHLLQDIHENNAASVEGRVQLNFNTHDNTAEYFMLVDETKFRLGKKEMFLAMKNGDPYRIYYAARSKEILSLEWLRENDDNLIVDADDAEDMTDTTLYSDAYSLEEKPKQQTE